MIREKGASKGCGQPPPRRARRGRGADARAAWRRVIRYMYPTPFPRFRRGRLEWAATRHVKKCGSFLNLPKTVPGAFKSYLLTWRFCRPNLVPPFHLAGGYTKLLRPTKSAFVNAFGYPSATRRRSASLEANAFAAPADASCTARAACARKSGGATGGEGRPLPRGRR